MGFERELIGWIGSVLFAICGIPQAWQSYKDGHSKGLSWLFLLCWFFGEVLVYFYVWMAPTPTKDWPLLFNYTINIGCLVIIFYYKMVPKIQSNAEVIAHHK